MGDQLPSDSRDDPRGYTGTPRWVKLLGIAAVVVILLVVAVMLIIGGEHGPGRHTSSGDIGGPADSDGATRVIEITSLDTMTFEPSGINVSMGETVTFVVTNSGQTVHEFTLGDAAMQQEHADEMAEMGNGMAHDGPTSITLQPGETKELTWRFADAGVLEYACHEPGRYQDGMRGQVTIS